MESINFSKKEASVLLEAIDELAVEYIRQGFSPDLQIDVEKVRDRLKEFLKNHPLDEKKVELPPI